MTATDREGEVAAFLAWARANDDPDAVWMIERSLAALVAAVVSQLQVENEAARAFVRAVERYEAEEIGWGFVQPFLTRLRALAGVSPGSEETE